MTKRSIRQCVDMFAVNGVLQDEAIMRGDAIAGNNYAKQYIEAFQFLCGEYADAGREELSRLFIDERPGIRGLAACFLLRYKTEEALATLEQVSRQPGLIGFAAGECIKRWNASEWNLDLVANT